MTTLTTVTREAVPVTALPRLEAKVKAAERKCARWGLPAPRLETADRRNSPDPYWEGHREDAPLIEVVDVSLTAPESIGIPGWALLARIDALPDGGHILIRTPGTEDTALPEVTDPQACEHCGSRRHRKDTFLVLEEATGRIQQVGRNCLGDHLGYDPERLLWWSTFTRDVDDLMSEPAPREERLRATSWVLLTSCRIAARIGYMSARKADELAAGGNDRRPLTTRTRVEQYAWDLDDAPRDTEARLRVARFDEEFPADEPAQRLLTATTEALNGLTGREGEWQDNLRAILIGQSGIRPRHMGIAVSAVLLGLKAIERPEREVITSVPLGSIGERLTVTGRVTFARVFEGGGYGYGRGTESRTLIKFRVGDSDCIWWASRFIDIKEDDDITITATVKEQGVDRFTRRMATTFTRGSIKEPTS